jgi:hypothetical protein
MAKIGTVTLQALDMTDIFLKENVFLDGIPREEENRAELTEPGFDTERVWVTGNAPKPIPVKVPGDVAIIYGWFNGVFNSPYAYPYTITIYVEYEEVEELLKEND